MITESDIKELCSSIGHWTNLSSDFFDYYVEIRGGIVGILIFEDYTSKPNFKIFIEIDYLLEMLTSKSFFIEFVKIFAELNKIRFFEINEGRVFSWKRTKKGTMSFVRIEENE